SKDEKRKRRVRLSKPNVLHPEGCWHPEGEGYLAEESQALELDNSKSGGRNGQLSIHSAFVSFGFEGMRNSFKSACACVF
ncbi:hypothetical protein P4S88_16055, partial [Anoxybacillus geothermalis]|nr:hypothetical protein [Anoxybacillus geothermalis]